MPGKRMGASRKADPHWPDVLVDFVQMAGEEMPDIKKLRYALSFVLAMDDRERKGLESYGSFDPASDTRNLSVEAQEEIIDVGNYMRFLKRKRPELSTHADIIKRKAFSLYVLLRELENEENKHSAKGDV